MIKDFFSVRDDKITSYVIFILANSCMPTLLKLKPSTLISFYKKYIENAENFFNILERETGQFMCSIDVLYENADTFVIIIYHPELLNSVLNTYCSNSVLNSSGYRKGMDNVDYNLMNFKIRFQKFKQNQSKEFPHEVGILLGYPIDDVEEFIKNKGKNYIFCGYWKVYHNVEEAVKTFRQFQRLRNEAMGLFYEGKELREIGGF